MGRSESPLYDASEEARRRRLRLEASAEALKERVEGDLARARAAGRNLTDGAVRYRWPLLGVAAALGFALGRGRRKRFEKVELSEDDRTVLLVRTEPAPSSSSSLLGMVTGLVARKLASAAAETITDYARHQLAEANQAEDGRDA